MRDPAAPRTLSRAYRRHPRGHPGRPLCTWGEAEPRVIATQCKVSLSVVREALTRLTEQDLVVAEPRLGFSVGWPGYR